MFLQSSRYYNQKPVDAITREGLTEKVISLRRLTLVTGNPVLVNGNDRLDIIAQQNYGNPTMFWHIADANTELWANDLIKKTDRVKTMMVPGS